MFRGETINTTEGRAALHTALRQPRGAQIGGAAIEAEVLAERARMLAFAESIRRGGRFDTVINIGIGGSDLGPAMAAQALRHFRGGASAGAHRLPTVHFVANVDGCALSDLLENADPARTLFVVCSKTFTTQETLANARVAREWIAGALGEAAVPAQFAAVSVNAAAMDAFGIHPDQRFRMWDWGGGPILDVVLDRVVARDRDRRPELRGAAGGCPCDGPTFPRGALGAEPARADGAARCLEHRYRWTADARGAAL
jgi:glucose-6-phosphate isomerase